jgi:hypothetical protein
MPAGNPLRAIWRNGRLPRDPFSDFMFRSSQWMTCRVLNIQRVAFVIGTSAGTSLAIVCQSKRRRLRIWPQSAGTAAAGGDRVPWGLGRRMTRQPSAHRMTQKKPSFFGE